MTQQQRYAEVLLELVDLPAESGLGNVKVLGRLADRSVARDRREIAQA
jgi:hypothetical protein